MTCYRLEGFTMAEALAGKIAGITERDDGELEIKVTYPAAKITGITGPHRPPYPHTGTGGAEMTDARTGAHLGHPAAPARMEHRLHLDLRSHQHPRLPRPLLSPRPKHRPAGHPPRP